MGPFLYILAVIIGVEWYDPEYCKAIDLVMGTIDYE